MERGQAVQLNSYAGSRQRRRHSCSRVVGVQGSGDGGGQFNGWKHMGSPSCEGHHWHRFHFIGPTIICTCPPVRTSHLLKFRLIRYLS